MFGHKSFADRNI